jgi:uncharacterized phosphosugar-binding protein
VSDPPAQAATTIVREMMTDYLDAVTDHLRSIAATETPAMEQAAGLVADHVAADKVVYVYGPGGHSNLAAQEVFFRAGGLVNISAILDEGTLLSSGALRSMAIERTPGYGRLVMEDNGLGRGDLLVLVNAYGINAALIDAALWAREHQAMVIGVSSRLHAESTAPDHPARHPSKKNLHDIVDVHIDTKVPVGDAVLQPPGSAERVAAVSTFANAYAMNCLMASAAALVAVRGIEPTIWRSGNAPGGDQQHRGFVHRYRGRVRWL